MLTELGIDLRKSVVTAATVLALAGLACPQPAWALGGEVAAMTQAAASGASEGVLPALLESRLIAEQRTPEDVVLLFYQQRGFRPVWMRPEALVGLIEAVGAAADHGLDPADFGLEALRREAQQAPGALTVERQVERELLFTRSLARLVQQLRHGKVDPRRLYRDWNFSLPASAYVQAERLAQLLQAPNLAAAVQAQAPDGALYRQLQAALQQYRITAAAGDWPKVPTGPTLRPGERGARVAALRARLVAEGEPALASSPDAARFDPTYFDPTLAEAVKRFQQRAGLAADAAVGRQTVDALNVGPAQRLAQIRVNLERLRWVAQDMQGDHLMIDLTGYHADLYLDAQLAWSSKVIVGKPTRETPALLDSVQHLVLNPKWVVPPTILREDVIPGVVRNPDYLVSHRMRVVDRSGQAVDPQQIDWENARRSGFPYMIVQNSGADGSLGRIKFSLANPYSIYLHDTNARSLFRRDTRALSSGCVRLEKPQELAVLLLDDVERWSPVALEKALATGKTRTVPVAREIPVLLHYATAGLDAEGRVQFRPDIYGRDAAVQAALDVASH